MPLFPVFPIPYAHRACLPKFFIPLASNRKLAYIVPCVPTLGIGIKRKDICHASGLIANCTYTRLKNKNTDLIDLQPQSR